jgi:hypothetical protein
MSNYFDLDSQSLSGEASTLGERRDRALHASRVGTAQQSTHDSTGPSSLLDLLPHENIKNRILDLVTRGERSRAQFEYRGYDLGGLSAAARNAFGEHGPHGVRAKLMSELLEQTIPMRLYFDYDSSDDQACKNAKGLVFRTTVLWKIMEGGKWAVFEGKIISAKGQYYSKYDICFCEREP